MNRCDVPPMTTCVTLFNYQAFAEEEGFEPPELALGGFQDRCLRPLGHSSGSPEAGGIYRDRFWIVKPDLSFSLEDTNLAQPIRSIPPT